MIYIASDGQKLHAIVDEAAKLRTPDNVPALVVVLPGRMGDGHRQMVSLDDLASLV